MLAVATGALGFGLFGAEFPVSTGLLPIMKFVAGGLALAGYAVLALSVGDVLQNGDVTGRQLVRGPLRNMFLVVVYVVFVFAVGILDGTPSA